MHTALQLRKTAAYVGMKCITFMAEGSGQALGFLILSCAFSASLGHGAEYRKWPALLLFLGGGKRGEENWYFPTPYFLWFYFPLINFVYRK